MSTDQNSPAGSGVQIEEPEVVVDAPESTTPDAEVEAEAAPEEKSEDDAEKALKRMQRRIDKRTADIYRARAENEQLKQRLAELEAKTSSTETPQGTTDPVALAKEISKIERFTEKANEIVANGSKAHTDYLPVLKDLASEVGDFVKPNGAPSGFMEVVLEVSEKPHALLYYLGKNPEIASELVDLNPIQLAKKLDRIEREITDASKPKTSNAPKPITPVQGSAASGGLSPDLPIEEWMRRRNAQIKANRGV
jgi:hypothetical protein